MESFAGRRTDQADGVGNLGEFARQYGGGRLVDSVI
jgi:hypothetical protein